MSTPSFHEAYCAKHNVTPERFAQHVLPHALYPHARIVHPFIAFFDPGFFEADYDFIHAAGLLRRTRDLSGEVEAFAYHPRNSGFWRRKMRVRVSSHRLRRIMRETMHSDSSEGETVSRGTMTPFSRD